MSERRRKHWGWGFEDEQPARAEIEAAAAGLYPHLGFAPSGIEDPVPLEQVRLRPPRVQPPAHLAEICATGVHARASHALGKSYCDVVAGFRGRFEHPPDVVARPRDEHELERVLEWCEHERLAAIPFGGGTSVVGGVTPDVDRGPGGGAQSGGVSGGGGPRGGASYNGAVSIDMGALDGVLEVDDVSRSARIQAGATGPQLERQLAEHGLTLRHFPQSFEHSTLGGWIATRAAGHFATLYTHVDDLVESVRALTPSGAWASRRLPGSGAGPSPDRMLIGSEGILGAIVEAWVRVQPRPVHRASAGVRFARFDDGVQCVRALSQSGLNPSNCRLIDAEEARFTFAGDGSCALLVLGFESHDHEVEQAMRRALDICAEHGGEVESSSSSGAGGSGHAGKGAGTSGKGGAGVSGGAASASGGGGSVGTWRTAFLRAPYVRDLLVAMGVLSETFETAITWERFPALHERVVGAAQEAIRACGGAGRITCRFTHVYPDGPAAYYTVLAPAVRGQEAEQWGEIKRAVSDVLIAEGATITHHHAVGRDHRPWYEQQRPDAFAAALKAAKLELDPAGIMNPGVLT